MPFQPDTLYDQPQTVADFAFDERVVSVFPDMIHRSVPGYGALLKMLGVIGAQFVPENGLVYDLGCSLGGASFALRQFMPASAHIVAVDVSDAMVERLRSCVAQAQADNITVEQADILAMPFAPCAVVILNFTLQFLPREERLPLLMRIHSALQPGGALLLAQKTHPQDARLTQWHEAFKRAQGYSALAVAQKRQSLEAVMQTDSAQEEVARLHEAGFRDVLPYFQGMMFCAWLAVK